MMNDKEIFKLIENLYLSFSKSKVVDDFSESYDYIKKYNEYPSVINFFNERFIYYDFDNVLKQFKEKFKDYELIHETYDSEDYKIFPSYSLIKLADGYHISLRSNTSDSYFTNPKKDIDKENEFMLISNVILLKPISTSNYSNKKIEDDVIEILKSNEIEYKEEQLNIGMVSVDDGDLFVKDFIIHDEFKLNHPDLYYGEGFSNFHTELLKKLKKLNKGLILLDGDPGTGKSYYIRYLIKELSKEKNVKVLYYPPSMINSIIDPNFINFITDWAKSDDRKPILLLEDAEPLLESRKISRNMGITNLLNISDGILNNILGVQIILTFNTDISNVDDALLREERLIARKKFKKINLKDTLKICELLNIPEDKLNKFIEKNHKKIDKKSPKFSLSQIYSLYNNNEILRHGDEDEDENRLGFNKK